MAKTSKSQWDFGELFPPQAIYNVLSVTELTFKVRRLLEKEIGNVWVTGEVTNLRIQSSGHIYFTLKDPGAQLSCVLFRGENVPHRELIEDGKKLVLQGDLTVYEVRGQYQLIVHAVEMQGTGALQVAFEKLKQKLQAEGLFANDRKRPIPRYPCRIGIVTSPTGAAIRDILHVIKRRHPGLELILASCRVQGAGSAEEIACAIELLNQWSRKHSGNSLDMILVTRGGGNLEDLWAFNEEQVARAIFHSALPVVSAVGHEIDFTISDFVADFRAATPSAAAELITEGFVASRRFIADAAQDLARIANRRLKQDRDGLLQLSRRLMRVHPRQLLNQKLQHLDDLQNDLLRCVKQGWRDQQRNLKDLRQRLWRVRPSLLVANRKERLVLASRAFFEAARHSLKERHNTLSHFETRLRLLSPANVLERGYSITRNAQSGDILRDARQVQPGQKIKTTLSTGEFSSTAD